VDDDALRWAMKETTLTETERVRRLQDKEAPRYDRQMGFFDRILFAGGREWACSRVEGEVLELAVGTGRNLPYYPADVRLTGIELSPQMLEIGKKRAEELGRDVVLRIGDAQALAFEDQSFDTVILTFGLCTIPDDRGALGEAHRVLRPGGRLVLLEHVRSPSLAVRAVQRALDPLSVRFAADHLVRDPLDYLGNVGFEIESVQRLKWGIVERVVARKSGGARRAWPRRLPTPSGLESARLPSSFPLVAAGARMRARRRYGLSRSQETSRRRPPARDHEPCRSPICGNQ
jgi:ubiquinone/menaquinone biosynthesis C-methylase UbiE